MNIGKIKFEWDPIKSLWLKSNRGISFEELTERAFIADREHPMRGGQRLLFYLREDYIWVVPAVDNGDYYFLKTTYASRKYTRIYFKEGCL